MVNYEFSDFSKAFDNLLNNVKNTLFYYSRKDQIIFLKIIYVVIQLFR